MDPILRQKVDTFFQQGKQQLYKKGEIIIRADDHPAGIFYLTEGTVKEYAISQKGDEVVVNVYQPISFFPMSWAINNTPNDYFFEAMTDVSIWRRSREDVVFFIKNNSDVLYDLMSRVYKGTDGLLARMTYLMSGNAYLRLVTELLIYVRRFGKGQEQVKIVLSEKEIAAQAGMTRETVSREMKILKDKGLIAISKNQLVILDIRKLEDELSAGV